MHRVVMKFGGACFASPERTRRVAERIAHHGALAVVVVSARQGVTDHLLDQMRQVADPRGTQARDMLLATGEMQSAALLAAELLMAGHAAEVIAPWLVFRTDAVHGNATIRDVHTEAVLACLDRGAIPVVPGFIGAADDGSVTTLGRGGSDYSAVALGVALGAARVDLFKAEVDGVYDADPHTTPDARRFGTLSHSQALALATDGARVLQDKAAALALHTKIGLCVRAAFHDGPGTQIRHAPDQEHLSCQAS